MSVTKAGHGMWVDCSDYGQATDWATRAAAVQAAIQAARTDHRATVYVPAEFLGYDASKVTFDPSVQMVREGQLTEGDVVAYGADRSGEHPSTAAFTAALNFSHKAVTVPAGTYHIDATIYVSSGQSLRLDRQAVLRPAADVPVLDLASANVSIDGGVINTQDVEPYRSAAIQLRGSRGGGISHPTYVRNMGLYGKENAGSGSRGIYLVTSPDTPGHDLYCATFENVSISGFNKGIEIEVVKVPGKISNINSCIFSNIMIRHSRIAVRLWCEHTDHTMLERHLLTNVIVECHPHAIDPQFQISTRRSMFTGITFWDFKGERVLTFDQNSSLNVLLTDLENWHLHDGGKKNTIVATGKVQFGGERALTTADLDALEKRLQASIDKKQDKT